MIDNGGRLYMTELSDVQKREVLNKLARIEKSVLSDDMPDVVKVFALNKYIVITSIYDTVNYHQEKTGKIRNLPDNDYSLYGIICRKMGVCAGVAKAMCVLLERQNIECKYVSGDTTNGGRHAWNVVKLNGTWYMLDVTWNLCTYYSAKSRKANLNLLKNKLTIEYKRKFYDTEMEKALYKYFLLTDSQARETRTWDYKAYPTCIKAEYSDGKYMDTLERYERTGKKRVLRKTIWAV